MGQTAASYLICYVAVILKSSNSLASYSLNKKVDRTNEVKYKQER